MKKKEIAELAVKELEKLYPDASCTLDYEKPYELMFAARLAAQCTDARVNIVTKTLFKKYPTLQAFADADLEELEQDVKPCGFYHTKAKSLKVFRELFNPPYAVRTSLNPYRDGPLTKDVPLYSMGSWISSLRPN